MRVITKQTLIATTADRFREAHQRRGEWYQTPEGSEAAAKFAKLAALPSESSEEAISAIIGDNRWTENLCNECGEDSAVIVLLGEESHHPTDAVAICLDCLKQAKRIAEASH
jgi:hypothetical protein